MMVEGYFKGSEGKNYFRCECGMILVSGTSLEHLNALIKVHKLSKFHLRQLELQKITIPQTKENIKTIQEIKIKEDEEKEIEDLAERHSLPLKDKIILRQEKTKNKDFLNKAEFKQ